MKPATYSYPEPHVFITSHRILVLRIHFNIILPSLLRSFKLYLSFRLPHQNPECISLIPHTYHMPIDSSRLDHQNNIWYIVPNLKLYIIQFYHTSLLFLTLGHKYFPQNSILENPRSVFLPSCERPSSMLT